MGSPSVASRDVHQASSLGSSNRASYSLDALTTDKLAKSPKISVCISVQPWNLDPIWGACVPQGGDLSKDKSIQHKRLEFCLDLRLFGAP